MEMRIVTEEEISRGTSYVVSGGNLNEPLSIHVVLMELLV